MGIVELHECTPYLNQNAQIALGLIIRYIYNNMNINYSRKLHDRFNNNVIT